MDILDIKALRSIIALQQNIHNIVLEWKDSENFKEGLFEIIEVYVLNPTITIKFNGNRGNKVALYTLAQLKNAGLKDINLDNYNSYTLIIRINNSKEYNIFKAQKDILTGKKIRKALTGKKFKNKEDIDY